MLTAFERTKNYANRMGIGRSLPPVVRPPLYPIWQLIRGCKSRSSESGRTATPDLFRVLLPYHNGNNNNSICKHNAIRTSTYEHTHAHPPTATTPHRKNRDDTPSTISDAPLDRKSNVWQESAGEERTGTAERERGTDGHCEPEKWVRTWHRGSGPIARAPGVFFVFMCSFSVEVGQWVGHLVGHLPVH